MENNTPHTAPSPRITPSAAKPYPGVEITPRGNGRGWILVLAILQGAGAIVMFAIATRNSPETASFVLTTMLGLSALFFGLWIWGKKAPFAALLTTLVVFISVHLLDAVFDPMSLFRGIILKIAVIVGLSTAIKRAYTKKREAELQASQS